ncbi:MAG: SRPBCC family protein [Nocardioidaceae bacterium]
MQLTHQFAVPASIEETWTAFNDLELIAPCFPGATLSSVEGDEFTGGVKVKLGPISLQYNGSGHFVERDEAGRRAVIEAKGKDKRGNGTASATITAHLTEDGGGTNVAVDTDLNITGKPAQFGRGVIQDVSDKLLGQFVDCIAGKLGRRGDQAAPEDETAAPAASTEPTAPAPERSGEPASDSGSAADDAELNLMSTVGPVIARRVAPYAIAAVIAVILYKLLRR